MTERSTYDLRGSKLIAIGCAIMALAMFVIEGIRVLKKSTIAEIAFMALMLAGWVLIFVGCLGIKKYRREFGQAYILAMLGIVCAVAKMFFALKYLHDGIGEQAFMALNVQFADYCTIMFLLFVYIRVLNGSGELCRRVRYPKKGQSCRRIWKPSIVIIVLSLFAMQIGMLFSDRISYITVGVAAVLALIFHLLMIQKILQTYELVDGRSVGQHTH